jgi:cytoskeletal protein RodZ
MENEGSIGAVLRQARENRGLSLHDVQESTKITVQNLSALEENRFDSFPNRVYARAFLRDYANFLNLDSSLLLARYEEEWQREPETEQQSRQKGASLVRRLGYSLLGLVVVGGLAAGSYYSWQIYGRRNPPPISRINTSKERADDVAQLPKTRVTSDRVEKAKPKPAEQPKPQAKPTTPQPPEKLVLEVTTLRPVWVELKADGVTVAYATLPPGTRVFEAKKKIYIKVGQADGVRLKMNGQSLPPLGNRAVKAERVFALEKHSAPAIPPTSTKPNQPAEHMVPTAGKLNR